MRTKMLAATVAAGLSFARFGAQAQASGDDLQAPAASVTPDSPGTGVTSTRVGGTVFFDLTHIDQTMGGAKTDASGTTFDVKRFYLSVDHTFNGTWSANLTTDFSYSSDDGKTQLFVKKAYVQGAFSRFAILRVGSASMPWIPLVEDWYGYRFVEKVLVDRMKFGNSADWGAQLSGDSGVFNYQVSAVNGGGYRDTSRSDHVDFAARMGLQPVKGLMFAIGGYEGYLGNHTQTSPVQRGAKRYDAMAAWNRGGLRLGAEWFRADNWKNITTPLADSADGWSAWGSYDFERMSVFARYDRVNPSKTLDASLTDTYWNAGVAFPVAKGVKLAIAYKDERLSNGGSVDLKTREIGAWGEIRF